MSPATRRIAAAAPGQWSIVTDPDNQSTVQVQFAGARDSIALTTQLERWEAAMRAFADQPARGERSSPVASPSLHQSGTDTVWLQFNAPRHIGADGLPNAHSPHDVLVLLRATANALDALHAQHVVHGGLGLPSLWWMTDGSLTFPDAGLTHTLDGIADSPPLAAGYRSPEVWHGRGIVPASDQYSLAAIAFDLFSGRQRVVHDGTEGITSINPLVLESGAVLYPGAPPAVNHVIQRALSAEPAARFPSCTAFVEALEGHIVLPKSLPTFHKIFRRGENSRWRSAALATVAVASVIASVWAIGRNVAPSRFAARMPNMPNVDMSVMPTRSGSEGGARAGGGGAGSTAPSTAPTTTSNTSSSGASTGGSTTAGANNSSPSALSQGRLPDQTPSNGQTVASGPSARGSATLVSGNSSDSSSAAAPSRSIGDRVTSAVSGMVRSVAQRVPDTKSGTASGTVSDSDAGRLSTSPSDLARPAEGNSAAASPRGNTTRAAATTATAATPSVSVPTPSVVRSTGTIQLQVASGSRIYLDGVLQRPIASRILAPVGSHDVDIISPSGGSVRRRVTVLGGETVVVRR